jgi:hypothetical protein
MFHLSGYNRFGTRSVPPKTINHPAPYPEDLPHRLIRMFTKADEWVMDPFNGAGADHEGGKPLKVDLPSASTLKRNILP